jgi:hypothetical protein
VKAKRDLKAEAQAEHLRRHAAGPPKTDTGTGTPGPDTTTTGETADRIAPIPTAEINAWLGTKGAVTSSKFKDGLAAWQADQDPFRDLKKSVPVALKRALGLADDTLEVTVTAEIGKRISLRERLAKNTPVTQFRARVDEVRGADSTLSVADAQRRVAAEEPELYAATRSGRVDRSDFDSLGGTRALAEEARRIRESAGVPIAEAQRLAAQRWPELAQARARRSNPETEFERMAARRPVEGV